MWVQIHEHFLEGDRMPPWNNREEQEISTHAIGVLAPVSSAASEPKLSNQIPI